MKTVHLLLTFCVLLISTTLFAQDYEVYISEAFGTQSSPETFQILKVDANGENCEVFINNDDNTLAWPQDILFIEAQNIVLISNFYTGRITKYNADTGEYLGNFATGIGGPTRLAIKDDLLYVLQWNGNGKVLRFELDGTPLGTFTDVNLQLSIGIDWDAEGNLYVSSYGQPANGGQVAIPTVVKKFDASGTFLQNFIPENILSGPTNIWFDPSGNGDLLICDYNAQNIKRYSGNGAFIKIEATGLPSVEGFDYLPNGNLLVGSATFNNIGRIKMYDSNFQSLGNFFASGTGGCSLKLPNAVRVRILSPNTVADIEAEVDLILVTPSIGNEFSINATVVSNFKTMHIYNSMGALIETINIHQNTIWNAGNYPEGIYFVIATTQDGQKSIQKIIVATK